MISFAGPYESAGSFILETRWVGIPPALEEGLHAVCAEDMITHRAAIRRAAFESAYLEMPLPDPASPQFATLVARHEARLGVETPPPPRLGHEPITMGKDVSEGTPG